MDKRLEMKKDLIDLEYYRERQVSVRDLEWMIEMGEEVNQVAFDDRRKAPDKLSHLHREIAELKIRLLEE